MRSKLPLAGLFLLLATIPVAAHHNFAAAYDSSATITLTGVVTRIDWTNPHVRVYLDVKDESGKVVTWSVDGYPPIALKRLGFNRDMLKNGDTITVTGYQARENPTRAAAREVTLADGAKYNLGPQPGPSDHDWYSVVPLR